MATKSQLTQKLANEYPEWSDIRSDEQSLGQQFINTIANPLEDMHVQLRTLGNNYYIGTANQKDIDVIYKVQMPLTKTFDVSNNDPNNPIYIPPTVSGISSIDNQWHQIIIASGNDIESFWYGSVPTSIECSQIYPINNIILDESSNNIYTGVTTFTEDNSPQTTTSGIDIDFPKCKLWAEIYNGEQFLNITNQGLATRGSITIEGTTRKGQKDTENLIFIHNEILQTQKEWSNIERVYINDIIPGTAKLRLIQHRFSRTSTPIIPAPTDFTNLAVSVGSKEDIDLFWDVSSNISNLPILQLLTWQVDDIKSRVSGLLGTQVIRSFELLDTDGTTDISTPIDIAVETFSQRLWVATANKIYIYDSLQSLPNMRILTKKQFDSLSVIEPSSYHITKGESVELAYIIRRPITDVVKHRVYVTDPNGNNYSVVNGSLVAFNLNNSWLYATSEVTNRNLRAPDIFTLNIRGDWLWNMDIEYTNGSFENDQRIVSVDSKRALASFSLSSALNNATIEGLDFDSDQNIWALINIAGVRSKIKITPHFDTMLIDYDKKILIFRENYSQIKVL